MVVTIGKKRISSQMKILIVLVAALLLILIAVPGISPIKVSPQLDRTKITTIHL
jgi:hypothetical protein